VRLVRIQVSARVKYRGKDGFYDTRSLTLEVEVESGDSDANAIWDAQRQLDGNLESWIDLHRGTDPMFAEVEPAPAPIAPPPPVEPPPQAAEDPDDRMPF
jgi:hypothetical protein